MIHWFKNVRNATSFNDLIMRAEWKIAYLFHILRGQVLWGCGRRKLPAPSTPRQVYRLSFRLSNNFIMACWEFGIKLNIPAFIRINKLSYPNECNKLYTKRARCLQIVMSNQLVFCRELKINILGDLDDIYTERNPDIRVSRCLKMHEGPINKRIYEVGVFLALLHQWWTLSHQVSLQHRMIQNGVLSISFYFRVCLQCSRHYGCPRLRLQ